MGKYSLDAFEVHPLVKLRPVMTAPESSCYQLLELELGNGILPSAWEEQTILRVHLNTEDIAVACGDIRRLGACCDGGKDFAGVVLAKTVFSGTKLTQLVWAYRQAFHGTVLLVEPGTEAAEICRREGISFGLWLDLRKGILPLRRSIARENLARNWERCPVYLFADRNLIGEELDAARRWHSSGANVPAPLGPRMTLRRMMFPRNLTAGGVMPLRMWWQNVGTAPLYRDVEFCLELRNDQGRFPITITETGFRPGIGDSTVNMTAVLPGVQGEFTLWCGLRENGSMLPLSMKAPEAGRMYEIGSVTLDDISRPYLATMWEEQYADGYYPLEDPAQPE